MDMRRIVKELIDEIKSLNHLVRDWETLDKTTNNHYNKVVNAFKKKYGYREVRNILDNLYKLEHRWKV